MTEQRGYQFLRINERQSKPRTRGITEIRGPYTPRWANATYATFWRQWGRMSIRMRVAFFR